MSDIYTANVAFRNGYSWEEGKMLFCIEFERELEDKEVLHAHFDHVPTRQEIIDTIHNEGFSYDDDYGKLTFYKVHGIN